MKAIVLKGIGLPPEYTDTPDPVAGEGEVLVALRAAALNHRDIWISKGQYAGLRFPIIPASDGSGISDGKEIIILPSLNWGDNPRFQSKGYSIVGLPENGTLAEKIVVPAKNIYPKPAHLSFTEAAALPLAGLTAWRAVFSRAGLQEGESILITGAGGGVAQFAIQFAVAAGAQVWVTSGSDEKIEKAKAVGAIGGANYRNEGWEKHLKNVAGGFDVVIDSAGGDGFSSLLGLCNPGGRIAIYGGTLGEIRIKPQLLFWKQVSILGSTMGHDGEFADMLKFVEHHRIVPVVDKVFPLSMGAEAFQYLESGQQFGKVVLEI